MPAVQRNISQVTLDKALMMLAGDAFDLAVDPLHRKIAFILKENMVSLYGSPSNIAQSNLQKAEL